MGYDARQTSGNPNDERRRFIGFEDLDVYKGAREFRKQMYALTRSLPEIEKYGLAGQIRRAAVSLTNNIAEGHGRYHFADQVRFFLGARGSLQELIDDLNVCLDEKYAAAGKLEELKNEARNVLGLINGFLRYLRDRKANDTSVVREAGEWDEVLESLPAI